MSVQRPATAQQRYGREHLAVISDSGKTKFTFDDSLVRITLAPITDGFAFRLENKTLHSIRIVWDDAAIVDPAGESGRVLHSGVKYVDRNSSQPPTVVVAKGFVTDIVVPTSNVTYSSGAYGGWHTSPFLPRPPMVSANREAILSDLRERYTGKSVKLLLPLQIEGFTNDYLFTFSILGVQGERAAALPITETARPISQDETRAEDSNRKISKVTKPVSGSEQPSTTPDPKATVRPTTPMDAEEPLSPSIAQSTIGAPRSEADRQAGVIAFEEAQGYVGTHEWAKAEQTFQKAILYDGSVAKYHAALGSLMMLLHRWADAQASYSAAVLLDVDNPEYRRRLKEARARR